MGATVAATSPGKITQPFKVNRWETCENKSFTGVGSDIERRKFPPHRYMCEIEISLDENKGYLTVYSATTFEVSEGGPSAALPIVGELA